MSQAETINDPASSSPERLGDTAQTTSERIGDHFMRAGLITAEQLNEVLALQRDRHLRFGQAAIHLGFVSQQDVQTALSQHFNYATAIDTNGPLGHLAIASAPFSAEAEAIRHLRSNLTVLFNEQPSIAFAVTSARAGEGKSYIAASLAVAFSQTGLRTLLINANLREAGQQGVGEIQGRRDVGLSTMLARRTPVSVEQPLKNFPTLFLLDAGPQPPNPLEILTEPALRNFLLPLRESHDVIVVDTPSALASSDAQVIARQVDGSVLVAREDVTWLKELRLVETSFLNAGARILGTVYNAIPRGQPKRKSASRNNYVDD